MDLIPRRDVDFGLSPDHVPRDWCAKSAYETTLLNALSLLFPEGERFFVDSVKHYKGDITDPALLRAIAGFIGQEAMHGKEHRAFNDLMIEHGFTEAPAIDRGLRAFLGTVRRALSPASQLAVTCALEHFTAMLAEALLDDRHMRDELHESIQPLWLWHALEESEHKAVAFDVYETVDGSYARRIAIMLLTTAVFFAATAYVHARLMRTRGIFWKPWRWVRGATRLWLYPGYFGRLLPAYLAYFKPGFHPDERDTRELLASWRERLFGEAGTLRERTRVIA
jgi:predicted metal-dependent hydrolase